MESKSTKHVVLTLGHSNRELDGFLELLGTRDIGGLIDMRSYPKSNRFPHFSKEPLESSLGEEGVDYEH